MHQSLINLLVVYISKSFVVRGSLVSAERFECVGKPERDQILALEDCWFPLDRFGCPCDLSLESKTPETFLP